MRLKKVASTGKSSKQTQHGSSLCGCGGRVWLEEDPPMDDDFEVGLAAVGVVSFSLPLMGFEELLFESYSNANAVEPV
tara:strand:+ start:55 stop:288 length:234 start_codon:yes stop_codon:yes gene_type:complete